MNPDLVMDVGQSAMEVMVYIGAVVLLPALAVGLLVAMFQAATQINEMTLSFIPKLIVVVAVLVVAGPWMLQVMMNFTLELLQSIPDLIG